LITFCAGPLQCATLERLTLDDMIGKSTCIVRATVADSGQGALSGPIIYTHYRLKVSETLKGNAAANMEVAVPGGKAGNFTQTFAGAPQLNAGEEYVFFLWTGKSGLTQVMGLTQGLFAISPGAAADPVARRAATRELMLERGTGQPVKDQALSMRLSELRTRIARLAKGGAQ
jgi:hypothetical protein